MTSHHNRNIFHLFHCVSSSAIEGRMRFISFFPLHARTLLYNNCETSREMPKVSVFSFVALFTSTRELNLAQNSFIPQNSQSSSSHRPRSNKQHENSFDMTKTWKCNLFRACYIIPPFKQHFSLSWEVSNWFRTENNEEWRSCCSAVVNGIVFKLKKNSLMHTRVLFLE